MQYHRPAENADGAQTELRVALSTLRLRYHHALARRFSYQLPPDAVVIQLIASEPDESEVAANLRARSAESEAQSRLGWIHSALSRLARWR